MSDDIHETEEEYLRKNNWAKFNQTTWWDRTGKCTYTCCHEVALLVQRMRDKDSE